MRVSLGIVGFAAVLGCAGAWLAGHAPRAAWRECAETVDSPAEHPIDTTRARWDSTQESDGRVRVAGQRPFGSMDGARIDGQLEGRLAPGFGDAWILEAYRLTDDRNAVVERRRAFVTAAGRFELDEVSDGEWQLAMLAPNFRWGPRVRVDAARSSDRISFDVRPGRGAIELDAIRSPTRVSARITALRPADLEASDLAVRVEIATRLVDPGTPLRIEGLASGCYEVATAEATFLLAIESNVARVEL
ncbi:MAG: hypothetical protein KDB80_11000 [Planctomycetes bacterium]|nr:hypothetical protein [Planctomycetota bacterium]